MIDKHDNIIFSESDQHLNPVPDFKTDHRQLDLVQHHDVLRHDDNQLHHGDNQLLDKDQEFQHKDPFHLQVKEQELKYRHQEGQDHNIPFQQKRNLRFQQDHVVFQGNVNQSIDLSLLVLQHHDPKYNSFSMLSTLQTLLSLVHLSLHRELSYQLQNIIKQYPQITNMIAVTHLGLHQYSNLSLQCRPYLTQITLLLISMGQIYMVHRRSIMASL